MASLPPFPAGGPGAPAGGPPLPIPGGTGAATVPGGMPGVTAQAMTDVKTAVEALQRALPKLPMGSKVHTSVLHALSSISKNMEESGLPQPGQEDIAQSLVALARQNAQGGNLLAGIGPGGPGGPPGAPPGAPPLPVGA